MRKGEGRQIDEKGKGMETGGRAGRRCGKRGMDEGIKLWVFSESGGSI